MLLTSVLLVLALMLLPPTPDELEMRPWTVVTAAMQLLIGAGLIVSAAGVIKGRSRRFLYSLRIFAVTTLLATVSAMLLLWQEPTPSASPAGPGVALWILWLGLLLLTVLTFHRLRARPMP